MLDKSVEDVFEDDMFDDEQHEDLEEPISALKNGYPKSNLITFKPITIVGCMVRSKKQFPDCWFGKFKVVDCHEV